MKVVHGRPRTVLLTAKDEGVEIFYASGMKARVVALESTYYAGREAREMSTHTRAMSHKSRLPKSSDFPAGTEFVVKEFDVPLARVPGQGWFNWFGGEPRPYDERALRVDNNWPAESFEEWVRIVEASLR